MIELSPFWAVPSHYVVFPQRERSVNGLHTDRDPESNMHGNWKKF